MQNSFLPYSDPVNLDIIHAIGDKIILDIAPEEELSARKLTDHILQKYEQGELLTADTSSNDAGGFGSIDLVTLVAIPLLVTTLGEICKQLVAWCIRDWKEREDKKKISQMIDIIVEEKYKEVDRKVKSKKSRRKGKAIRDAVKIHIKNYLELE